MQWSHVIALAGIVLIMVVWVGVQGAWRRTFPGACADPDVLAARRGCSGCDSSEDCDRRLADGAGSAEEGAS